MKPTKSTGPSYHNCHLFTTQELIMRRRGLKRLMRTHRKTYNMFNARDRATFRHAIAVCANVVKERAL